MFDKKRKIIEGEIYKCGICKVCHMFLPIDADYKAFGHTANEISCPGSGEMIVSVDEKREWLVHRDAESGEITMSVVPRITKQDKTECQ